MKDKQSVKKEETFESKVKEAREARKEEIEAIAKDNKVVDLK